MRLFRPEELHTDPTPVPEPGRFVGNAFSSNIASTPPAKSTTALIRLDNGARGHWHRHEYGQFIHVTSGAGMVGRRGMDPLPIAAGDSVWIEPGEEHWHGAASGCHLAQLAVSFGPITWLEESTAP